MKVARFWAGGALAFAIAAGAWFVLAPGAGSGTRANAEDLELVALGERVYAQHCASCHGGQLEGQPNWRTPLPGGGYPAPPHDATGHTWHHPDQLLFDYTQKGGQALVGSGGQSNMPSFGDVLGEREIWAVIAFIKSTWPEHVRQRQAALNAASR